MKTEFSYSLWLQSAQERDKRRESIRKKIPRKLDEALEILSEQYAWDTLYVFGSVVRKGRFTPGSDIDIALGGLNKYDYYAFMGDISSLINRTIDVINVEECYLGNSPNKASF